MTESKDGGFGDGTQNQGRGQDPGAARYGNFMNYYSFNPPKNRMKNIPEDLLKKLEHTESPVTILDIGCNAGDLTSAMFHAFSGQDHDIRVLGVDLDHKLIDRAKENFMVRDQIEFESVDVMGDRFQENVDKFLRRQKRSKFDLVTVFSVTMWVHLNHGDKGLEELVRRLFGVSRYLLLEPQPWKCYQTAARRMRKLGKEEFEEMNQLKIRGPGVDQEIIDMFTKMGCSVVDNFGESKWNRKLVLLKT